MNAILSLAETILSPAECQGLLGRNRRKEPPPPRDLGPSVPPVAGMRERAARPEPSRRAAGRATDAGGWLAGGWAYPPRAWVEGGGGDADWCAP